MYPTTCDTPGCPQTLFTVNQFRGVVETKCPRCRTIQTHRFGSSDQPIMEVRCPNTFKGRGMGGWCNQMVAKISPDTAGQFGYRCPRCKHRQTLNLRSPALAST